ncbi:ABC transporter permease [Phycisphaerales bacterium AB-hyl4]|uniref:ABC transporter permease n=1 Tax=Natronomicrosphaera hydrolytica TaxID=3242702 RepID=A0ABV4U3G7_9BACT
MRWLPWEYAVRNMGRSPLRLALMVGGSALVVLLVLTAAGFVRGMNSSLQTSGSPDNVIILAAGSEESVERSEISAGVVSVIGSSVAGLRSTAGVDYVSPEIHLDARLHHEPDDERPLPVALRGVTPEALLVHRQVRLVHGHWPEAGQDQVLVGRYALHRLDLPEGEAVLGRTLYFDGRPWTVTGVLASPGSAIDSEVWVPLDVLQTATRRQTLSCVIITLGEAELVDVELFATRRLDLEIVAMSEPAYYAQVATFYRPIQLMTLATAGLIGIGGLFGGLNTLYAAFAARVREFATLQTLGFSRRAILLSLVQEAVLATTAGGLLAAAVALLALDGLAVRFAMGTVGLQIDSLVLAIGLVTALGLGLVGALPPAIACLRLPITTALKAV